MESLTLRKRLETRLAKLYELAQEEDFSLPPGSTKFSPAELAEPLERTIERYVRGLIESKNTQRAILERPRLVERWNLLSVDDVEHPMSYVFDDLSMVEARENLYPPPYWPPEVAPLDIAEALKRTGDKTARPLIDAMEKSAFFPRDGGLVGSNPELYTREVPAGRRIDGQEIAKGRRVDEPLSLALRRWGILGCALVVSLEREVRAALHRPMIALDAGQTHHELLTGLVRASAARNITVARAEEDIDRVELILPGQKTVQLMLPLDGESLSEAFMEAIRKWRSFLGLRHWAALQRLLSIEGGRSGRVMWKLDTHLDALGLSKRWREDPKRRRAVAEEIALLTKMELAVYGRDGRVRMRAPILSPTAKFDVDYGGDGAWALEGMELRINPMLYGGVRELDSGKLGKHWYPAPAELAKIDHVRHPHAIALGLVLPIRWRWIWAEKGLDHLTIEAGKLLNLAAIPWTRGKPGRAWDALDRTLEELLRIGELGRVEWSGEKHTLAAKVHLYPADWLLDRTVRGLVPIEKPRVQTPTTGEELVTWRKEHKLSQAAAAKQLGVGVATVKRAESAASEPLGRALIEAFKAKSNDAE